MTTTATASSVAVDVPPPAAERSAAVEVPRSAARPVAPAARSRRRAAREERWVFPFAITLAVSLVFFLWQMAEYTTLLG
jgi:hypothetical protein